ncbi:MAG: DUF1552 domain-containing protein [Planctomycetales bacterium]|nr:DUF1552 domain-containing protein [Planctomycetales bacterium]
MTARPKFSRRVVLSGLGATVALPWLESARLIAKEADAAPPKRFAFLFFGDGIHPPQWWAKGKGTSFELGEAFASLESVKQKLAVINGLQHPGNVVGGHAKGAAGILTGVQPKGGREIRAAISLDQLLARQVGDQTSLPSMVLACERPVSGFHESGYSMMYASHVSWSSPVSPVPAELHPALAFDSLFESQGSRVHVSVLDHVLEQLNDVSRKVSRHDKAKIDEYATSVREVEQRLRNLQQRQAAQGAATPLANDEKRRSQRPAAGLPTEVDDHARLMCDIIALAFQTDRTRIATMLLTNNLSGQVYPFLGLRDDHHSFSHGWNNKEFASITRFWVEQYAYLVTKLDAMPEGDGTVLDNSCIMLANEQWTAHNAPKIPLLLSGGLGGSLETGLAMDFESSRERKFSALLLSIAARMGVELPAFGNATEPLF